MLDTSECGAELRYRVTAVTIKALI